MGLKDKVAFVTDSAHRIGRQIALALAEEGCHLMVHFQRAVEEAEKTCSKLVQAVLFLLKNEYITGEILVIDVGLPLW